MHDPSASSECPFARYYRGEMRMASVALFLFVAANYTLAPFYRAWFLGAPETAPQAIWLIEYGVILTTAIAAAAVRWRWSEREIATPFTLAAVAVICAAIIGARYVWTQAGVPFFNELIGYFLIAAMVMTGIEYQRLCWIVAPALFGDSVLSYVLHGWGPIANFELLSNLTAACIAVFTGWFFEKNMRQVWAKANSLELLAQQDALTHLLNRRGLSERAENTLKQAVRDQKPVAVAMLDLDHFKSYNDLYGHPAGDAALQAVALVLAEHARRPLDLVARTGGEEFVILWFATGADGLERRVQRLADAIRSLKIPHAAGNPSGHLTISLGAVTATAEATLRISYLVEQADLLLYEAKQKGRDQAVIRALQAPLFREQVSST